jgi:hypothetical protein
MNLISHFDMDNNNIQAHWRYSQKTINRTGLSLSEIIHLIDVFMHSVLDSLVSGELYAKNWDAKYREWMYNY